MKAALPAARCFVLPQEVLRTRSDGDIPLMHVEDHDPLDRLQEAAREHRNTRTWPRVQAVSLAKRGDTAPQIARALGVSRRAVQAWVAAYNRGRPDALRDRPPPRRGAPPPRRPGLGRGVQPRRPGGAAGPTPSRPGTDPAPRRGGPIPRAD